MDLMSYDDALQNDKIHNPMRRQRETKDITSSIQVEKDVPTYNVLQLER